MNESGGGKLTKEEYLKQKDLEAARKAGTAPAEVDEEGNEINPHIPQYIAKAPWYVSTGNPSLKHQRNININRPFLKSSNSKSKSQVYCTNCGATGHVAKECLERPQRKPKHQQQQQQQPSKEEQEEEEEEEEEECCCYDEKRDRWTKYDPTEHDALIEEWAQVEEERRRIKQKQIDIELLQTATLTSTSTCSPGKGKGKAAAAVGLIEAIEVDSDDDEKKEEKKEDDDEDDEERYAEDADMVGTRLDMKSRQTVRNLRIREDIPKYLRNLDLASAYYDPKTRSMRDNPNKDKDPSDLDYAGDNFVRHTGDSVKMTEAMLFAWQAAERGHNVHFQANPLQAELLHKEYLKRKRDLEDTVQSKILEKYKPKRSKNNNNNNIEEEEEKEEEKEEELDMAVPTATEDYNEYAKINVNDNISGKHKCLWGSHVVDGKKAYACCHSTVYRSYCTGESGKRAQAASSARALLFSSTSTTTTSANKQH